MISETELYFWLETVSVSSRYFMRQEKQGLPLQARYAGFLNCQMSTLDLTGRRSMTLRLSLIYLHRKRFTVVFGHYNQVRYYRRGWTTVISAMTHDFSIAGSLLLTSRLD